MDPFKELVKALTPKAPYRVLFQGKRLLFIPNWPNERTGPLTTPRRFREFALSYAHCFPDGKIRRFGQVIGTFEDMAPLPIPKKG